MPPATRQKVVLKLTRKALKQLKRNGRLKLSVAVSVSRAGATASKSFRLKLKPSK